MFRLSHLDRLMEPQAHHQAYQEGMDELYEHHARILYRVDMMTGKDATSVLRDRGQRSSEAMCMTHDSQNISRCIHELTL
jgi:hypothetical protein